MTEPIRRADFLRSRQKPLTPRHVAVQDARALFNRDGVFRGLTFEAWMAELVDPATGKRVDS